MMRKLMALLLAVMLLLGTTAQAADTVVCTIGEIGVRVTIPNSYNIILTRYMDADEPEFRQIGLDKATVDEYMINGSIYLDAMQVTPRGTTSEIVVTAVPSQLTTLDAYSLADVETLIPTLKANLASVGATVTDAMVAQFGGHTYILLEEDVGGTVGVQCFTIQNGREINITLTNWVGELTQEDADVLRLVLESATYLPI